MLADSANTATSAENEPGQLLDELEQRQDDVLLQLDDLDAKIKSVLKDMGATLDEDDLDA